ncbi:related to L-2.3-butanediol dehydrogenase [Armillaria ostoyae]|uniref:Related to L-2.3-butanediol dehydrogenase n=1 Tax=Armillaria ostoyae TaxID=47428 RepID=A0A284QKG7_ARMOS|nr:related to L-2.3-butanediol dehydrogenase [Armillaria ostoyae]
MISRTSSILNHTALRIICTRHVHRSVTTASPRTAIVTGAGQGIGRGIALRLAQDGFNICVNDLSSNPDQVKSVVEEITSLGGRAVSAFGDVSKRTDVEEIVKISVDTLGPLTVMVANAGIAHSKPILNITEDDLRRIFEVNVMGVFNSDAIAAKQFIKQGTSGKILNAASGTSFRADHLLAHYSATKAAVRSLTHSFAMELGRHRITVNAYAPGIVASPMWEEIDRGMSEINGLPIGQNFSRFTDSICLGRTSVPDDPAKLVSFLAGPDSDYMTGQTIVIDGGNVFV